MYIFTKLLSRTLRTSRGTSSPHLILPEKSKRTVNKAKKKNTKTPETVEFLESIKKELLPRQVKIGLNYKRKKMVIKDP